MAGQPFLRLTQPEQVDRLSLFKAYFSSLVLEVAGFGNETVVTQFGEDVTTMQILILLDAIFNKSAFRSYVSEAKV